jgi:hypothetical protein
MWLLQQVSTHLGADDEQDSSKSEAHAESAA